MSIFTVGRVCVKLGRDAGRKCVVVKSEGQLVLVDGDVRRKKVSVRHLEPLEQTLDIAENAAHDVVAEAFKKEGYSVWERKSKKVAARQVRQRTVKKKVTKVSKKAAPKVVEKKVEAKPAVKETDRVAEKASEPVTEKPVEAKPVEQPKEN